MDGDFNPNKSYPWKIFNALSKPQWKVVRVFQREKDLESRMGETREFVHHEELKLEGAFGTKDLSKKFGFYRMEKKECGISPSKSSDSNHLQ